MRSKEEDVKVAIELETDSWGTKITVRMKEGDTADQFIGRIFTETEFIYKQIREYLKQKQ